LHKCRVGSGEPDIKFAADINVQVLGISVEGLKKEWIKKTSKY